MLQIILILQKLESLVLKNQKLYQRKIKSKEIKMILKVIIISIKLVYTIKTYVAIFAFYNFIVKQIDKNTTFVLDVIVYYIISANAILYQIKILI